MGLLVVVVIWLCVPMKNHLEDKPSSFVLFDENQELLGARIATDGQWRFPKMESVPNKFKLSLFVFEDKDFESHIGIDFTSLGRAVIQNVKEKRVVSGASTLTMQLMRMHYPKADRNILQKIKEMTLALKKELHFSKNDILLDYCTHAPFGGNVVGLETASWRYFGKSPDKLSWSESCLLAVLPNAPSLIHPGKNRERLKVKRNNLLGKLFHSGHIDSLDYQLALLEPIVPSPKNLENFAPHFLEKVKRQKSDQSRIYTTINKEIQRNVLNVIADHKAINQQKDINNAGAIIINNRDRSVKAYIGNTKGKGHENYNDMVMAPRSSGSILKPILYGLAIDDGLISPIELTRDIPLSFNGFSPKNYNKKFYGAISYDQVISKSLNVPSVDLLQKYNLTRFLNDLRTLGFETIDKSADYYGLPLILGGADVCLWDLAKVYSNMAQTLTVYTENNSKYNDDNNLDLHYLSDHRRSDLTLKFEQNAFSAGSIWSVFEAMKKVERPNEDGQWEKFSSSKQIHWKTGTSYGHKDAWAVGVTPEFTVAVWVGNSDGEPRPDIIGVKAAGTLLFDIFNVLDIRKSFELPYDDCEKHMVCTKSGQVASQFCKHSKEVFLPSNSNRVKKCQYHKSILLNQKSGQMVYRDCLPANRLLDTVWFELSPEWAFYYKKYHPSYSPIPKMDKQCKGNYEGQKNLAFIYPKEDSEIVLPRNLKSQKEHCVLKASHKDSESTIFWHVNNQYYGKTEDVHELSLDLDDGEYLVSIQDVDGNTISRSIKVLLTD